MRNCSYYYMTHSGAVIPTQIYHSGVTIEEECGSDDIASSYPGQLMLRLFPIGQFTKVTPEYYFSHKKLYTEYAAVFRVYLDEFRYIGDAGNPYIPISKLKNKKNVINDNGRALSGSGMIAITDIDWKIIAKDYSWKKAYFSDMWISKYGPLPDEFKDTLMEYFRTKTLLKGDDDHVYEYMKSKNKLNT